MNITSSTIVAVTPSQISTEIDGETVVLELQRGAYFGLAGVGSEIWQQLQQPRTVAELTDAIVARFEVEPERCERDLLDLLRELHRSGLVELREGPDP